MKPDYRPRDPEDPPFWFSMLLLTLLGLLFGYVVASLIG
jgi:hypothetical protein